MDLQFGVEFQLGDAAQIFLQNSRFDLELMLVAGVLIVAAATALKIRAPRLDPSVAMPQESALPGLAQSQVSVRAGPLRPSRLQDERHEYGFASATFVSRQAGQTVAAIDELFNSEFQDLILQTLQDQD